MPGSSPALREFVITQTLMSLGDTPKHENDSLTHRSAVPPLPLGEGWEANRFPALSLGERVVPQSGTG